MLYSVLFLTLLGILFMGFFGRKDKNVQIVDSNVLGAIGELEGSSCTNHAQCGGTGLICEAGTCKDRNDLGDVYYSSSFEPENSLLVLDTPNTEIDKGDDFIVNANSAILQPLNNFLNDSDVQDYLEANNSYIFITSVYRSYQRQSELFVDSCGADADVCNYIARPGESQHQSGRALDFYIVKKGSTQLGVNIPLEDYIQKYGFIRPTSLTGDTPHFYYIGGEEFYYLPPTDIDLQRLGITREEAQPIDGAVPSTVPTGKTKPPSGKLLPSEQCKAGYNPGSVVFSSGDLEKGAGVGLASMVQIVTAADQLDSTVKFINEASSVGITPIIRMCYNNTDENNCADFKKAFSETANESSASKFALEVLNKIDSESSFVFIAGPNEPISERWILDAGNPMKDSDAVLPSNTPEFLNYFTQVGKYTKDTYDHINSGAGDNRDRIQVVGVALNLDFHGCGGQTSYIDAYIAGLGGDLGSIDGLAGNTYNKGAKSADSCYTFIRDHYLEPKGLTDENFNFHITEFGPFEQSDKGGLKEAYDVLVEYPEVKSINFFTPFAEDGLFSRHKLSASEISDITSCEAIKYDPSQDDSKLDRIRTQAVPYAPYYEQNYSAYEMRSCEVVEKGEDLTGWHRMQFVNDTALQGYQIVTAKVDNFPQLGHFGNIKPSEYYDNGADPDFAPSPFDPICSILVRSLGSGSLISTHEHPGMLNIYSEDDVLARVAMPKLGNAIACLNLFPNPLIPGGSLTLNRDNKITPGINDPSGYKGFSYVDLDLQGRFDATEGADESVEVSALRQKIQVFTLKIKTAISVGIENLVGVITDKYSREPNIGEPHAEYETPDGGYCYERRSEYYEGPPVNHLNTTANEDTESYSSGEQVVKIETATVDLNGFCDSGNAGVEFRVKGLPKGREQLWLCYAEEDEDGKIVGLRDFNFPLKPNGDPVRLPITPLEKSELDKYEYYYKSTTPKPNQIGIPGGVSGLGKFYEELQQKANAYNHNLIAPQNGTKLSLTMSVYDPYRNGPDGFSEILDIEKEITLDSSSDYTKIDARGDVPVIARTEYPQGIEMSSASNPGGFSDVTTESSYEFIIPLDLTPYFIAYEYNYNGSAEMDNYFLETNQILRSAGFFISDGTL